MVVLCAVETATDVELWRNSGLNADIVVALSVEALRALDAAGVPYTTIEDYYSEAELRTTADDGNQRVRELCGVLDRLTGVQFDDGPPAFSAHYYAGRLRVLRDSFLRAVFVLKALCTDISPTQVVLAPAAPPGTADIWIDDPRFLSYVLADICRQRGIAVKLLPPPPTRKVAKPQARAIIMGWLRRWRDHLRAFRPGHGDVAYYLWPNQPNAELLRRNIKAVALPSGPATGTAPYRGDLSAADEFFRFGDIATGHLARPHMAELLGTFRARHVACLARMSRALRRSRAKVGLASAALSVETVCLLLAARRIGLPTVALQHGGFAGYCRWDMLPFIDLNLNRHYLVYSMGVAEAMRDEATAKPPLRPWPVQMRAVGSPTVAAIRAKRGGPRGTRPKVLYVCTFLCGSTRYLAGHHRADIAYWRTQCSVLGELGRHLDHWDVMFRPPPHRNEDTNLAALETLARNSGIQVCSDGSLADLLVTENFDLIVTDAVTTVLLEVLATDARVITWFDPDIMRLDPGAAALLAPRADVALSTDDYIARIGATLAAGPKPAILDDGFLHHYALVGETEPDVLMAQELAAIALE